MVSSEATCVAAPIEVANVDNSVNAAKVRPPPGLEAGSCAEVHPFSAPVLDAQQHCFHNIENLGPQKPSCALAACLDSCSNSTVGNIGNIGPQEPSCTLVGCLDNCSNSTANLIVSSETCGGSLSSDGNFPEPEDFSSDISSSSIVHGWRLQKPIGPSVRFWCPLNLARNPNPHMKMRIRTLRWQCVFDLGSFVGRRPMHVQDCVAHGAVLSQSDTFVLVFKPQRQAVTDNEPEET